MYFVMSLFDTIKEIDDIFAEILKIIPVHFAIIHKEINEIHNLILSVRDIQDPTEICKLVSKIIVNIEDIVFDYFRRKLNCVFGMEKEVDSLFNSLTQIPKLLVRMFILQFGTSLEKDPTKKNQLLYTINLTQSKLDNFDHSIIHYGQSLESIHSIATRAKSRLNVVKHNVLEDNIDSAIQQLKIIDELFRHLNARFPAEINNCGYVVKNFMTWYKDSVFAGFELIETCKSMILTCIDLTPNPPHLHLIPHQTPLIYYPTTPQESKKQFNVTDLFNNSKTFDAFISSLKLLSSHIKFTPDDVNEIIQLGIKQGSLDPNTIILFEACKSLTWKGETPFKPP
jgi:hypothetical protein